MAALVASCLALAGLPGAATAAANQVEVGQARLATAAAGTTATLLIPVRYPIEMNGRLLELAVSLRPPGRAPLRSSVLHERASAGPLRLPERRRAFTFVHRLGLAPAQSRAVRSWVRDGGGRFGVRVRANGTVDLEGDGQPELGSSDREMQALPRPARHRLCSTVPQLRARPGKRVSIMLPVCGSPVRWRIDRAPEHGSARIRHGRLIYRPAARFHGADSVRLANRTGHSATASAGPVAAPVQVVVTQGSGLVVRAMGDSVTAGFGYYDEGSPMPFEDLLECKPGETAYNDACSSNSTNRNNRGTVVNYATDYGLANNVSWAAQWSNGHGVTNYKNFAVSGSEPSEWAPGGRLYPTTRQIEGEDPDYVLMTIGANLRGNLKNLYRELVAKTDATIYLMQYPVSIPAVALTYSATQLAMTGKLLNREISSVAGEVGATRLRPVAPPHFNVGIDISPVYRSEYSCSKLRFRVDGPSVQSEPSQDELEALHPLSFCPGPASGPPWVIGGDTGIHPSAAGYAEMAAQVPAPS